MAASGSAPLSTFPNDFSKVPGAAAWAPPLTITRVAALREKVNSTDWSSLFRDGITLNRVEANWSAGVERCSALQSLCTAARASKVLEIGAFCGVATYAMAEVLPAGGQLTALELDPYLVEFSSSVLGTAGLGSKVKHMVGLAQDSLEMLARRASRNTSWEGPFDFVLIDADKAGMANYFKIVWDTPDFLSAGATVCVDITKFKGQKSYVKSGKPDQWIVSSGHDQVDAFRTGLKARSDLEVTEHGSMLATRRRAGKDASAGNGKRGRSRSPAKANGLSIGAHPMATFPNDRGGPTGGAKWVPSQPALTPVEQIRKLVNSTDWGSLFAEGKTKMRVDSTWSANTQRCETLVAMCKEANVRRVLEVGSCCGVAALSMAETLLEDGQVVSLEFDPFLVEYTKEIIAGCEAGRRVRQMVGPAKESMEELAKEAATAGWAGPFDFAVVDADKASVAEYFHYLWDTPGLLLPTATVCVDMTPFKGQLMVQQQYVKQGKPDSPDEWMVYSGQEQLDALRNSVKAASAFDISERNGLLIARRRR